MEAVKNELHYTYGYSYQQIDTGGLKIVTTINLQHDEGPLPGRERRTCAQMRADGRRCPGTRTSARCWSSPAPATILAMYGGPNFNARNCARIFCQFNMATENREQVGSSFKPYVLATAVSEGMDVQNSILNGIEPMCIPPDSTPQTRLDAVAADHELPGAWVPGQPPRRELGPLSVPKAAAISSDPAFEDLIHRAGTLATINMAKAVRREHDRVRPPGG